MELNELRSRINQIDDEMLELFLKRMDVSEAIAAYKKEHGLPITNKAREREILAEMMAKGGPDNELYVYRLFSTLMDLSKARQGELMTGGTKVGELVQQMLSKEEKLFRRRAWSPARALRAEIHRKPATGFSRAEASFTSRPSKPFFRR